MISNLEKIVGRVDEALHLQPTEGNVARLSANTRSAPLRDEAKINTHKSHLQNPRRSMGCGWSLAAGEAPW